LERVEGIKMKVLPDTRNAGLNVRLTLDYEEDYWLLASIVRILGNDASRSQIKKLFTTNLDFATINLFRNDQFLSAQKSKML
jgi:hypothetical protein